MSAQLMRSAGDRQEGEPARAAADAIDHLVIGDRALALVGIGANPFALATGKLGERQVDAALAQLGAACDDLVAAVATAGARHIAAIPAGPAEDGQTIETPVREIDEAVPRHLPGSSPTKLAFRLKAEQAGQARDAESENHNFKKRFGFALDFPGSAECKAVMSLLK